MIVALASPSSASTLWYLTRGTGTVALLLLTAVLVLGVLARGGRSLPACPRFVTPALHRNLSLLAVAVLTVHIVTAVADPYAPIRLVDAVVPFVSSYRPIWLGLGAVAFDILIALIITSLLRARLGHRVWRAVHWAAYASWPVAVAHGLGSGTDVTSRWLLILTLASAGSVLTAVLWRILRLTSAGARRRRTAVGVAVAVPLLLCGFAVIGPLAPRWAARAGTPAAQLAAGPTTTRTAAVAPPSTALPHGVATFSGRSAVRRHDVDTVVFAGPLRGKPAGELAITLTGRPAASGGVDLSAGSVRYSQGAARYVGPVTTLRGGDVEATLAGPAGEVRMVAELTISRSQTFTGTVTLS
jgi:methionine sulfoxide reductase heme-binding subunit